MHPEGHFEKRIFLHRGAGPCPVNYGRRNKEKSLQTLKMYQERTIIRNNADHGDLDVDFTKQVVLGEFVDKRAADLYRELRQDMSDYWNKDERWLGQRTGCYPISQSRCCGHLQSLKHKPPNHGTGAGMGEKMLKQIMITGFGGQGVVLAGRIVGQAAAIGDKRESTLVQSYGPESRGGACSAQVTIADGPIYFPYIQNPDILVCMSQSGYDKYQSQLKPGGHPDHRSGPGQARRKKGALCDPLHPFCRGAGQQDDGQYHHDRIFGRHYRSRLPGSGAGDRGRIGAQRDRGKNLKAFERGWEFARATFKGRRNKAAGRIGVVA
jgi:2-oxoglutarate ferredoxin oxidoreductase subunit gamma